MSAAVALRIDERLAGQLIDRCGGVDAPNIDVYPRAEM
jgi:hypothetical protein